MRSTHLIYCLKCPFSKEVHYIGKSTQGMRRPLQHLTKSHLERINEWVEELKKLGYRPTIEILEVLSDDISDNSPILDERELWWITHYIQEGAYLLNIQLVDPILTIEDLQNPDEQALGIEEISDFIRQKRRLAGLTQEEFAEKAGVALTVIRKIEQKKTNVNLNGLLTVLIMFGYSLRVKRVAGLGVDK